MTFLSSTTISCFATITPKSHHQHSNVDKYGTKLLADFSLCAQTLGALFYYDPSDARVNKLIDLFTTSEWLAEWPFTQDYDCQRIDKLFQDNLSESETLQKPISAYL